MLTQTSLPLIFSTLEFLFGHKLSLHRPKILQTSFLNITDGKYMLRRLRRLSSVIGEGLTVWLAGKIELPFVSGKISPDRDTS